VVEKCALSRIAYSVMALALVCVACAGKRGLPSTTPQVTVQEHLVDGADLLLAGDEVRAIPGFAGVSVKEIRDVPIFKNPDTRGPCGAVVREVRLAGAVGRVFAGEQTTFEFVSVAGPEDEAIVAELLADHPTPCGPYQSTTNQGLTQTVSEIAFVDLPQSSGPAVAWVSRIDVRGTTGYGAAAMIIAAGHVALIQTQSSTPPDPVRFRVLVKKAIAKLAA
jgi:hypothetical protein